MSQPILGDPMLMKELYAFGREYIGIASGGDGVWAALHRVVPEPWWPGFMFMGVVKQGALQMYEYKHGITRRCLSLDTDGRAYAYDPVTRSYAPLADVQAAIERVFDDIERFGVTRETAYDDAYKWRRDHCLAAAGFHAVDVSDRGVSVTSGS